MQLALVPVMITVALNEPEPEHPPVELMTTGSPDVEVAATEKLLLFAASVGAGTTILMTFDSLLADITLFTKLAAE